MVNLKFVYILKNEKGYFTGSTYSPENVITTFRKNDPTSEFTLVCVLMAKEAAAAVRFLRYRMTPTDFVYWDKQSKLQQAKWLFKAAKTEPAIAKDFSNEFNKK